MNRALSIRLSTGLMSVPLLLALAGCAREPRDEAAVRPASDPAPVVPPAFTVCDPAPGFQAPPIILQFDPAVPSGADWAVVGGAGRRRASGPAAIIGDAAAYLREGIERMTGQALPVLSTNDLSRGIVLTLLKDATPDIRGDTAINLALADHPGDPYAANEAFVLRSETNRLLVVARTAYGLLAAVAELLEAAGYEVLGMGPNWIHVPDYRDRPLTFALDRSGRPGFYIRNQWATSGQSYGVGTITEGLTHPDDEPVGTSYQRWRIGTRMEGRSMPNFPGHALQAYHARVIERMSRERLAEGFLAPRILVSPVAERPEAVADNAGWLWVNADTNAAPAARAFTSDGKTWQPGPRCSLDVSSPLVRGIILDEMIQRARERLAQGFGDPPDNLLIFPMDPEDGGGYGQLGTLARHPRWYPDYLAAAGVVFGKPYVLHGVNGLDQPHELWDPDAASDHVYGLANFLLREFDQWVDRLPPAERAAAGGDALKDRVRCSFYCYNYHDVPPNFNLDPRIRVMIAGYPKHRGRGKWRLFASQEDLARAFKIMLPREPSGDYRIAGIAYYHDQSAEGLPAGWDASPAAIAADYRRLFDAGYRAVSVETDFNFGKYGLAYYLTAKMLWDPSLTAEGLDALRDRWFQRAYGGAWQGMKAYYDFMLKPNFTVNGPNFWAQAIRLIDTAARALDPAREPAAVRRIDDLKIFWYYHYLMAAGKLQPDHPETLAFLWKGQMSYMVAMHGPVRSLFRGNGTGIGKRVGEALASGPAHYTHAETEAWWADVLAFWPYVAVSRLGDATLADGTPAADVDLNDLVAVREFRGGPDEQPFRANTGTSSPRDLSMLVRATRPGDPVGFLLHWPYLPESGNQYHAVQVPYGADIWNPERRAWEEWIDPTQTVQPSREVTAENGKRLQVAEIRQAAPRAGTYRFRFSRGGDLCNITSLGFDPVAGKAGQATGFTFNVMARGHTQSPSYFYIPKGTRSLDFEIWDPHGGKTLVLHKGLPADGAAVARRIDVSTRGPHVIPLEPGEDGTVAALHSNGFAFPYLYSIPVLWAKSPGALLVPRAIAQADGLTVVE